MQTKTCWCLAIILVLSFASGIRINEVELNPWGDDSGNEWIELYSQDEINLTGWRLANNKGKNITLNFSFLGYYSLTTQYGFLVNDDIIIELFDSNLSEISFTPLISDSANDNRSWQFCSGNWSFITSSKNLENSCFQTQRNTTNQTQTNQTKQGKAEPYLRLDYDEEVENKEELKVDILAYNMENKVYDIKVWLEYNDSIISETHNEQEDSWKSSIYYVLNFLSEQGNLTKVIKLRLNEENRNFAGNVKIKARIRTNGDNKLVSEWENMIEIIKASEESLESGHVSQPKEETNNVQGNTSIIKLTKDIKSQEVWKSKLEYIKEYAVYGFTIFCVVALIVLIGYKFKKRVIVKDINN